MSNAALWGLGLLGLALLIVLCFYTHAPRIAADLTPRVAQSVESVGGAFTLDGRDVTLTGVVADEAERARRLEIVGGVYGVRTVIDSMRVAGGAAAPAGDPVGETSAGEAFALEAGPDGRLVLRGVMPSEDARAALVERVGAAFPGRELVDELTVAAGAAAAWRPSLDALLPALAPATDPGVRIEGGEVVITGTVPDAETRASVEAAVRAALADGYTLRNDLVIADAPAAPDAPDAGGDQVEASGSTDADVQAAEAALREALSIGSVEFESGTATLTPRSREILDRAAAVFVRFPAVGAEVQGHTDSQGGDASNQRLSQRRAEAVEAYLVEQGVEAEALAPRGFGEAEPIADNSTADGRARNRRVVFALRTR